MIWSSKWDAMASRNAQKYTVQIQVAKICHLYIWHLQEKDDFYLAIDHWDGCVFLARQQSKLFKCSSGPYIWLFPNIGLYNYVIYIYILTCFLWDQQRWETWMKKNIPTAKIKRWSNMCCLFSSNLQRWNSPKNGDDRVLHHVTAGTWADNKAHVAHDTGLIWEKSLGEDSRAWF